MKMPKLNILIVASVAPLYRLTQQFNYPRVEPENHATAEVIVRWSNALSKFSKLYGWHASLDNFEESDFAHLSIGRSQKTFLLAEANGWPELKTVAEEFKIYLTQWSPNSNDKHVSNQHIVQFFANNAGAIYRKYWEACTKAERILMYQLAIGELANPNNREPIKHLLRRGYLKKTPRLQLINESFRQFVLSAENPVVYKAWLDETHDGIWELIRIPLLVILLVVGAVVLYSATEALESFIALLTGFLALLPMIFRSASLIKSDGADADT